MCVCVNNSMHKAPALRGLSIDQNWYFHRSCFLQDVWSSVYLYWKWPPIFRHMSWFATTFWVKWRKWTRLFCVCSLIFKILNSSIAADSLVSIAAFEFVLLCKWFPEIDWISPHFYLMERKCLYMHVWIGAVNNVDMFFHQVNWYSQFFHSERSWNYSWCSRTFWLSFWF